MDLYEKYNKIMEFGIKNEKETRDRTVLDYLISKFQTIPDYHNLVLEIMMQTKIQNFRLEQQDFVEWSNTQVQYRVLKHKSMIDAIIGINRQCKIITWDSYYTKAK